jgi:hypothetical protein
MRTVWAALCAALAAGSGATVKTRTVSYKQGGTVLKGYVAYDDARAD